jgi:hypothetical protein
LATLLVTVRIPRWLAYSPLVAMFMIEFSDILSSPFKHRYYRSTGRKLPSQPADFSALATISPRCQFTLTKQKHFNSDAYG